MSLLLALAVAASPVTPGIYEGTIGTLPVRACFSRRDWGAFGTYYYRSRLRTIPLEGVEGIEGAFVEGPDDAKPRWMLQPAGADRLAGRWTGGARTLPIRLRRIGGGENPCSSAAFHSPRLLGVTTLSSPASKDGVAYSKLRLSHRGRFDVSVETFQLGGRSAAARAIDSALLGPLGGNPPEWFQCVAAALEWSPNEGALQDSLEPAMISARWLSVVYGYDSYCGGNHPNSGTLYRAFDRSSGREVDLHDWLNDAAVKRESFGGSADVSKSLRPAIRSVILAGWKAEADCDEVVRREGHWNIGLSREGLIFSPQLGHSVRACGEEFRVPFTRLSRFLTKAGAEHVRALRAER